MNLKSVALSMLALPRLAKRLLVMAVDAALCVVTVWLAFYLRLGEWVWVGLGVMWRPVLAIGAAVLLALPIFMVSGLYRAIFRYSGLKATATVVKAVAAYAVLYATIFTAVGLDGVPRTIGIIQPVLLLVFVVASRAVARYWLGGFYGAGVK